MHEPFGILAEGMQQVCGRVGAARIVVAGWQVDEQVSLTRVSEEIVGEV
jgi:hypothetical protein